MSLQGEINKISGGMRRAIQQVALNGNADIHGMPVGTRKIEGYVCAIHTDGELAGTVDVQEFNYEPGEYKYEGAGHHEGVYLSAIQDNNNGFLIIPQLFSDVVIVRNPYDGKEYVIMYSHAQYIQIQSHEEIKVAVVETEPFQETDDGLDKDFDELEETGKKAVVDYKAQSIATEVSTDGKGFMQEITPKQKTLQVGNTKIMIDGENVTIETSGKVQFTVGGSVITESDGKVDIKTTDATVKAENVKVDATDVNVKGNTVTITGGKLITKGKSSADTNGPYNAVKICPYSGAPHCGSTVQGT